MSNPTKLIPTPGQTVGPFYGYALPYTKDRFHRVELRAMRPDFSVQSRNGYFADAPAVP